MIRIVTLGAALLLASGCAAEFGAPDTSRGSADSPMTMLVDQTVNGVPTQGGTQSMTGTPANALSPGASRSANFGGMMRPMATQGGERR